jgi:hypothetical protein
VPAQSDEHDPVEGGVGLPVAAAVEPMPDGLAGGRLDWAGTAQRREGGVAGEAGGVVTGGDQQGSGAVGADAEPGAELGAWRVVRVSSCSVSWPISVSRCW